MSRGGATARQPRRKASGPDSVASWEHWWALHKDLFLADRYRTARATSSSEFSLGTMDDRPKASVPDQAASVEMEPMIRALEAASRDGSCDLKISALQTLGKLQGLKPLRPILDLLRDECLNVRASAAAALGMTGDPFATHLLSDLLLDTRAGRRLTGRKEVDVPVRCFAAAGLALAGGQESFAALDRALLLDGDEIEVALSAAVSLGALGDPRGRQDLEKVALDPGRDRRLRAHAVAALGRIGDPSSLDAMARLLASGDADISRSAILAMGHLARKENGEIVRTLADIALDGKDPISSGWALLSLGRIGGETASAALHRGLELSSGDARVFAAIGLALGSLEGSCDARDVMRVRREQKSARSVSERGGFAIALGIMQDRGATNELLDILRGNGSPRLRGHAAVALALLDAHEAEPYLVEALREEGKTELLRDVARALGRLGTIATVQRLGADLGRNPRQADAVGSCLSLGRLAHPEGIEVLLSVLARKGRDDTRAAAATALGLLVERTRSEEISPSSRLKADCNYALMFPALGGFFQIE